MLIAILVNLRLSNSFNRIGGVVLAVGRQERLPGSAHSGFDVGGLLPAPRYESGQWVLSVERGSQDNV